MNNLLGSLQNTLTDTLRLSLLHNISTNNHSSNGLYHTLYMGAVVILISFVSNYMAMEHTFSYTKLRDTLKMCIYRKHSIKLQGQTTTCAHSYNGKVAISTIYTDDFKALWRTILSGIHNNPTIYEIQEIKNMIRHRIDDEYVQKTSGVYIVSQREHFLLDESLGIYAYAKETSENGDDKIATKTDKYEITLYSYKSNASVLKKYIEDTTSHYLADLAESRYNRRFMYTLVKTDYNNLYEAMQCWRENEFHSSKTFDNVFFSQKRQVLDKIDFFLQNREWYDTHGIPYTLGIGLYGPPGTGKTSFIKALTNYLGDRHLVNMPMILIQTKKQLNDFYYESQYNELNATKSVDFMKKIIVIEDIDCAGDIVLERTRNAASSSNSTNRQNDTKGIDADYTEITLNEKLNQMDDEIKKVIRENIAEESRRVLSKMSVSQEDRISLDDILNLWDGIRETPGRILVISSNHYDKLDAAIRRPGRIDITLGLSNASRAIIAEMFMHFYGIPIDESLLSNIIPELYSPAEISNIYTMYRNDSAGFIARLCENRKVE